MRPISNGYQTASQKIDVELAIDEVSQAQMRFFVRSPTGRFTDANVKHFFPAGTELSLIPEVISGGAWPWSACDDPFVDASEKVYAARVSYLAPGIYLNYYLDWLLFELECEEGLHSVFEYEHRPSNVARRSYFETFAHSTLIALKSALDRLVSLVGLYVSGIAPHMTWGRIKNGKPTNFMSVVEDGRKDDELLEFLHSEYYSWIAKMVAPRDDIIHYADLQTEWKFGGLSNEEQKPHGLGVGHVSARHLESDAIDLATLHRNVNAC